MSKENDFVEDQGEDECPDEAFAQNNEADVSQSQNNKDDSNALKENIYQNQLVQQMLSQK